MVLAADFASAGALEQREIDLEVWITRESLRARLTAEREAALDQREARESERERLADARARERDERADIRDQIADQRAWRADERDRIADERDRIADQREIDTETIGYDGALGPQLPAATSFLARRAEVAAGLRHSAEIADRLAAQFEGRAGLTPDLAERLRLAAIDMRSRAARMRARATRCDGRRD
jgi:hypothetical protein